METLQSTLTYAIEIVVMSFVTVIVIDTVNSVLAQAHKAYTASKIQKLDASLVPELLATTPTTPTTPVPAQPIATPEFVLTDDPWQEQSAQLPDPWDLPTEIQPTPILPQAVVLPFPSLKLLPPAVEVQPKTKATKKSTTKPKSTTPKRTAKPTNKAATKPRAKSRKSA